MRNRRAWGYVVDISQHTSENTPTPYLFTSVVRMAYLLDGETDFSFARERVPTYAPNCLTSEDVPIQECSPLFGILLPTFGSCTDATFATWEKGSRADWRNEGLRPAVFTSDVDLDPWSRAPLPSLCASCFFTKKTSPRIAGLRVKHPILEVRQLNAELSKNFREPATLSLYPTIQSNYY